MDVKNGLEWPPSYHWGRTVTYIVFLVMAFSSSDAFHTAWKMSTLVNNDSLHSYCKITDFQCAWERTSANCFSLAQGVQYLPQWLKEQRFIHNFASEKFRVLLKDRGEAFCSRLRAIKAMKEMMKKETSSLYLIYQWLGKICMTFCNNNINFFILVVCKILVIFGATMNKSETNR